MKKGRSMSEREGARPNQAGISEFDAIGAGELRDPDHAASAGAWLREARQAQGMEIDTLAALMKVSVKKLQALERDEFELLLDPVFVRALASSVCRILKIDSAPVLQRLPAIPSFKVTSQNRGINTPFRAREGGGGSTSLPHVSKSAGVIGVALLAGAVALFFLPDIQQQIAKYKNAGPDVGESISFAEPASALTPVEIPIVTEEVVSKPPRNPAAELLSATGIQPSLPVPNVLNVSTDAVIAFSAAGDSWIQVTDGKGVVVLERTLRSGQSADASGLLPLRAVVGRADVIQVQVRGQAFGLSGVTSNNVARFEVK